jgi:hypothetical protein
MTRLILSLVVLCLPLAAAWGQAQAPLKMNFEGLAKRCEALKDSASCKRAVTRMEIAYNKKAQAKDGEVLKANVEAQDSENDFKKRYPELWAKRFE